jgi:hypothetical protein
MSILLGPAARASSTCRATGSERSTHPFIDLEAASRFDADIYITGTQIPHTSRHIPKMAAMAGYRVIKLAERAGATHEWDDR